jgi:hypothetical protein
MNTVIFLTAALIRAAMAHFSDQHDDLMDAHTRGEINSADYDAAARDIALTMDDLRRDLRRAEDFEAELAHQTRKTANAMRLAECRKRRAEFERKIAAMKAKRNQN